MKHWLSIIALLIVTGLSFGAQAQAEVPPTPCKDDQPFCYLPKLSKKLSVFTAVSVPKIATPQWLSSDTPQSTNLEPAVGARQVTYTVAARGVVTADLDEFKSFAQTTYSSAQGWSRLGVSFTEVAEGGDFTLWLAEGATMTSFSATGCDSTYSCRVGRNVIINQTRWLEGSEPFINAGGDLSSYRTMVLNHELGHWLGHGHRYCASDGAEAPLMQQQSINMQGCKPNAWPLTNEIYAPSLGIRS